MTAPSRAHRAHTHHAPSECPVCGDALTTTRLGCAGCGTELVGSFASCPFCALDAADLDLLKVFLTSRGNLKELEKHLQVSYPTARARFNAVLDRLGWLTDAPDPDPAVPDVSEDLTGAPAEPAGEPGAADAEPGSSQRGSASAAHETGPRDTTDAPVSEGADAVRDQVLSQVAAGILSPAVAADLLGRLR
ncbi:MAG: DUF2089 family protein [Propioniciclava sp.]|uniref:DUF2089 domain-containing protein n=1 Tax=Propioniciclava sp. TaxID=2038686 RepID=UPI0039E29782